ncbi:MAG: alanine/glycine:cation symporter family protein [Muribaculaceae bacterium]|nr:alanine/glycine:cation symporter family protein [Muribaculaceae bacterium]
MNDILTLIADSVCGYPLFIILIGGGLYLFLRSGLISLRRLPEAIKELRRKSDGEGQISSAQALASVVAATIGLGNIAGVAIALVVGGPGAIFWMWISAIVGMATKYHEGVLAIMFRGTDTKGNRRGGTMYIIENGLGAKWKPLALFFALAGMVGTLCIMNANQLTEAVTTVFTTPEGLRDSAFLGVLAGATGLSHAESFRLLCGIAIAIIVALVVLGGIKRIARVASVLVPFMVGIYFLMVTYIIATNFAMVPQVLGSIFREAFSLDAGIGGLIGVAIIGARRAALVNDAGVGTASIMHGESKNNEPVREGLIAMLGPSIDSGLVCTLTALALLLCGDIPAGGDIKGLEMAMGAFASAIPGGQYLLLVIVLCFGLSSMFSYSFYGRSCASYLFGEAKSQIYTYIFILSLILFAVIPLNAAVAVCDLFYALMTIPTMIAVISLSGKVRKASREYFNRKKEESAPTEK